MAAPTSSLLLGSAKGLGACPPAAVEDGGAAAAFLRVPAPGTRPVPAVDKEQEATVARVLLLGRRKRKRPGEEGEDRAKVDADAVVVQALRTLEVGLEGRDLPLVREAVALLESPALLAPSARAARRKRRRAREEAGAMAVDGEGEEGEEVEVTHVLQTLRGRIEAHVAAAGAGQGAADGGMEGVVRAAAALVARLCRRYWTAEGEEEGLGARCRALLWDLALAQGPSGALRRALLEEVLESFSLDELAPLMSRLLAAAGDGNALARLDPPSVLALVHRWYARPGPTPLVAEQGLVQGTLQGVAAAMAMQQAAAAGGAMAGNRAPVVPAACPPMAVVKPEQVPALLNLVTQGLMWAQQQPSPLPEVDALVALCLRLAARHPATFRPALLEHAIKLIGFKAAAGGDVTWEAWVFYRLYLACPEEAARALHAIEAQPDETVRLLCRGEALLTRPLQAGGPGAAASTWEKRMPEEVGNLCRLGADPQRDSEAFGALADVARRHPYLFLRRLPALAAVLAADASPASARGKGGSSPPLPAPFALPSKGLPPPSSACGGLDTALATFGSAGGTTSGGNALAAVSSGVVGAAAAAGAAAGVFADAPAADAAASTRPALRVRAVYWGAGFRPLLWQAMLDLVMAVPAPCLAAYLEGQGPEADRRRRELLSFCALYLQLLAVQKPPPAAPPKPADPVTAAPTATPSSSGKQSKKQQQQQQAAAAAAAAVAAEQSPQQPPQPLAPGQLTPEQAADCLARVAERLQCLLQTLQQGEQGAVIHTFLQAPLAALGGGKGAAATSSKPHDILSSWRDRPPLQLPPPQPLSAPPTPGTMPMLPGNSLLRPGSAAGGAFFSPPVPGGGGGRPPQAPPR